MAPDIKPGREAHGSRYVRTNLLPRGPGTRKANAEQHETLLARPGHFGPSGMRERSAGEEYAPRLAGRMVCDAPMHELW
jgi:hypothetical protein